MTSEHKMSWIVILYAVGAAGAAIAVKPGLPTAVIVVASILGTGAAAAAYSLSRGLAKQGQDSTPTTPAAPLPPVSPPAPPTV